MKKINNRIVWAALAIGNLGIAVGMRIEGHIWWTVTFAAVALGFLYRALREQPDGEPTLNR